ncbi:MAG: DMT family transporter [Hyphomicrobiaceae bacterium]
MSAYLPSILALAAAFLFAVSAHVQNIGLDGKNAQTASFVIIVTTAAMFWLAAPIFVETTNWWTTATLLFAASGLLRPTLSISLWTHGIRLLGPTLNSGIGAIGPIFTAIAAYVIVGEQMTPPIAVGTALVVAGIFVASVRGRSSIRSWPWWAILLPMAAELLRAIAHSITKVGFDEVPDPFFAALMATTVGAVTLSTRFLAEGRKPDFRTPGLKWFVLTGVITSVAFFILNIALEIGKVITVIPIVAISPVFAMLLGLLVFGKETITWRTFVTIALVVPGVVLVSLSR